MERGLPGDAVRSKKKNRARSGRDDGFVRRFASNPYGRLVKGSRREHDKNTHPCGRGNPVVYGIPGQRGGPLHQTHPQRTLRKARNEGGVFWERDRRGVRQGTADGYGDIPFQGRGIGLEKYRPGVFAKEVGLFIGLVSVSDRSLVSLHAVCRHGSRLRVLEVGRTRNVPPVVPLFVCQSREHPAPFKNHPFRVGCHHPGSREKISMGGQKNDHRKARVT